MLGCNGAVWVGPHIERPAAEFGQEADLSQAALPPPTPHEREATSRQEPFAVDPCGAQIAAKY